MRYIGTLERIVILEQEPLLSLYGLDNKMEYPTFDNMPQVEELLACMRGEEFHKADVMQVMMNLYPSLVSDMQGTMKREVDKRGRNFRDADRCFTFQCTDGGLSVGIVATLRRRFQLIDDYIEDTESMELEVPYSKRCVMSCINLELESSLLEVYDCLLQLNPKSNLYPFYYDTSKLRKEQVEYLMSRVTNNELHRLYTVGMNRALNLPSYEPVVLLSVFPSFRRANELNRQVYADYPSYFFTMKRNYFNVGEAELMLRAATESDWSKDAEQLIAPVMTVRLIKRTVTRILRVLPMKRSDFSILMAMMGIRHIELGNMKTKVSLPYLVTFDTSFRAELLQYVEVVDDIVQPNSVLYYSLNP